MNETTGQILMNQAKRKKLYFQKNAKENYKNVLLSVILLKDL